MWKGRKSKESTKKGEQGRQSQALAALLIFLLLRLFHHGVRSDLPEAAPPPWTPVRLDPGKAGWRELVLLPGVGEVGARSLARELGGAVGPLDLEDLLAVPGIGPVTARRIAPHLRMAVESGAGTAADRK
ncbi:MAG: ComEA family DNA-binding protein [Planctomycetota bacterium]